LNGIRLLRVIHSSHLFAHDLFGKPVSTRIKSGAAFSGSCFGRQHFPVQPGKRDTYRPIIAGGYLRLDGGEQGQTRADVLHSLSRTGVSAVGNALKGGGP